MESFSGRSYRSASSGDSEARTEPVAPAPQPRPASAPRQHSTVSDTKHHETKKPGRRIASRWLWLVVGIVALLAVAGIAWKVLSPATIPGVKSDSYQAVFLNNGQVYFGKLSAASDQYYKLTNIFYLQTQQTAADAKNPQKTTDEGSDVQLVKLGNEVHGPEDTMIISRDQVLFFENLKSDGKVSATIKDYLDKNK